MAASPRSTEPGARPRLASLAAVSLAACAGAAPSPPAPVHPTTCGACSTLQDLAVYLERRDLTAPARRCGMKLVDAHALACLEGLGFSHACAQIWLYDARNTRLDCFAVCLWSWLEGEGPIRADGQLNDCLRCDEERSGPVFKAVAGRTRRNSGIRSSIPRPEEQVARVVHDYVPARPPAPPGGR